MNIKNDTSSENILYKRSSTSVGVNSNHTAVTADVYYEKITYLCNEADKNTLDVSDKNVKSSSHITKIIG